MKRLLLALPLLAAGGCSTVVDVATLPVKAATAVVSGTIDATTTTQAEADRKRGRQARREDERRGREARLAEVKEREQARLAERERREAERDARLAVRRGG